MFLHLLMPENNRAGVVVGQEALEIEEVVAVVAEVVVAGLQRRNDGGEIQTLMAATPTPPMVPTMPMMHPAMLLKRKLTTCTCTTSMLRTATRLCGRELMFVVCLRLS